MISSALRKLLVFAVLIAFGYSVAAQGQAAVPGVQQRGWLDPNVSETYKNWLNEDVRFIITDKERTDFKNLSGDQQRDEFITSFWERRNPEPGAVVNKFKEEHYRRLAYANQHFAGGIPGWKTDRGRMYIMFGPPDSIDSKPGFSPPTETWRYSYIEGIGKDVVLEFIDNCRCGQYALRIDQK